MHRHHTDFYKLQVSSSALELLEGREGGIQVSSSSLDIMEGGEGGKQEVSSAPGISEGGGGEWEARGFRHHRTNMFSGQREGSMNTAVSGHSHVM